MKIKISSILCLFLFTGMLQAQSTDFSRFHFLLGKWKGAGKGFGNDHSTITSGFTLMMDGRYLEVQNESRFEPTAKNPEGEHHLDRGIISFDKSRKTIVFRQFHSEGFVNQYILNEALSSDSVLVFETESIENFIPGGRARWTIKKISETEIETIFDLSLPNKGYTCYGTNLLRKEQALTPKK
ncbi:MAG: hypothetical protein HYU71_12270 [Bacteroidetes bacterium]|nr:hypothetical protein [Bacteroidota bacterium]